MKLVGIYVNKARIVSILLMFPLTFIVVYAEIIFLFLGLDADASGYA